MVLVDFLKMQSMLGAVVMVQMICIDEIIQLWKVVQMMVIFMIFATTTYLLNSENVFTLPNWWGYEYTIT